MAITEKVTPIGWIREFYGLAGDAKPAGVPVGSTFWATDTQTEYVCIDGTTWVIKDDSIPTLKAIEVNTE